MKLTDQEQVILRAISQVGRGGLAEIARVVRAVGYPKATTKRVLVSLSKKGLVHLHRHDFPASLTPAQRKLLVRHEGVYYNAVSVIKRNPKGKHLPGLPAKAQREYEKILKEAKASGRYKGREKEVAARTVRKRYGKNPHGMSEKAWKAEENKYRKSIAAYRAKGWTYQQIKDRLWLAYGLTLHSLSEDRAVFVDPFRSSGGFTLDLNPPKRGRKSNKTVIRAGRIDHLDVSKVHNPRKKKATKKKAKKLVKRCGWYGEKKRKAKRNASRATSTFKTAKRRARSSSQSGRKKTTTKVRSVAKARKASVKRASKNPTRKGMRKLYREAKRISKITRGRYFSSESGQRKAARHEKQRARKGKRNPSAESIRKEFAGSINGERDLFFPQGTPSGALAKLGKLVSITTEEGTIKPVHGSAWLCADTKERLHIGSTSNAPLFGGPARNLGKVSKVEYESSKPHLGYKGPIIWFHHMGERGGTKPTLHADGKGGLVFKGGNYTLTRRGIEH